ncbi:hypothetical protein, partial [Azospirillum argentinense]|uniref:hypothetical protein n=1 Tax=Azospirillum argentinense TaxID=2970906 RepID=UPI002000092C
LLTEELAAPAVQQADVHAKAPGNFGRLDARLELVTVLSPVRLWIKRQGVTALSPERCQGRHRYP